MLVTLGNPSTQTQLGTREGIMSTRFKWFDYDTGTLFTHPRHRTGLPSGLSAALAVLQAQCRGRTCALALQRRCEQSTAWVGCYEGVERSEASLRCGYDRWVSLQLYPPTGYSAPFGRTMAKPIRSAGWRPFTIHLKARGASGTRAGNVARSRAVVCRTVS